MKQTLIIITALMLVVGFSSGQEPIDGNTYNTVQIGDQVWMAENLKVMHYRNGDPIPTGHSNKDWTNQQTGAYAVYDENESNADTYGYLYNWYAVNDSRNIAPEGWHVPTDEEWMELEMHLGMSQSQAESEFERGTNEGSKLAGNADLWTNGALVNDSEFGTSGFNALPGGFRRSGSGDYGGMGDKGYFWSSTKISRYGGIRRTLNYSNSVVTRLESGMLAGFPIRCIRD